LNTVNETILEEVLNFLEVSDNSLNELIIYMNYVSK